MRNFLLATFITCLITFSAQAKGLNKSEVEEVVKNYITDNGGLIAIAIEEYLSNEQRRIAEESIIEHSPTTGSGKIIFIEYADYRCGYCRKAQKTITELRKEYEGRVKFAFKFLPILSKQSYEAALAAQAANYQGKFWEFHQEMWDNQDKIGEKLFKKTAKKIGLNINKFNADRKSKRAEADVKNDMLDSRQLGIKGTPYFIVDGETISGAQPIETFRSLINQGLSKSKK